MLNLFFEELVPNILTLMSENIQQWLCPSILFLIKGAKIYWLQNSEKSF